MAHKTCISYKYSESQELRDRIIQAMGSDAAYYTGETSESPDSVNHVAAGFLWLHLLSVVGGRFPGRFYKVFQILHGGKSLSLKIGQGFADCL